MVIKKFIAPTMTEALAKVKQELGDEAVILKTRMNRTGGDASKGKSVEVTAAIERNPEARFELAEPAETAALENNRLAEAEQELEAPNVSGSEKTDSRAREIPKTKEVFEHSKKQPQPQSFFGNFSSSMLKTGRQLIGKNLSEELAFSLISGLARSENALSLGSEDIRIQVHQALCSMISDGEPIEVKANGTTVVMFVGMTGSGKTSAVAKVATHHKIDRNENVAIITTDNFRADSSQQIKSFCRILGCPCGIIYSPEELSLAIKSQPDSLILIDTPGVNPNDERDISELHSFIRAINLDEIHLVISASTPAIDVRRIMAAFKEFGIDKILITKLDETEAPGGVITEIIGGGRKLSYAGGSREIPGRFGVAIAESLADAMINQKSSETADSKWEMEAVGIWQ